MNATKTILATLALAAAISPALAATDGLPPNLVGDSRSPVQAERQTVQSEPQFLHGQGEVSLVPNPRFEAAGNDAPVRMGRITPPNRYIGA